MRLQLAAELSGNTFLIKGRLIGLKILKLEIRDLIPNYMSNKQAPSFVVTKVKGINGTFCFGHIEHLTHPS